jgi:hypothetical protein
MPALLDPIGILAVSFDRSLPLLLIFVAWAAVMACAWKQLDYARRVAVQAALQAMCTHSQLPDGELWLLVLPIFSQRLSGLLFLPHRSRLWIDWATPEQAACLLNLGPAWLAAVRQGQMVCSVPSAPLSQIKAGQHTFKHRGPCR